MVSYLGSGELPRRSGGKDSVIAVYQTFHTADAPMTLGLGNDNIWRRFCQAIGRPDMAADPRYANNVGRRQARAEIVQEIQAVLKQQPRDHWLQLFAQARIPAGPINRLDEVARDQALQERGLLYAAQRDGSVVPQVGLGIQFSGNSQTYRKAPPRLGEDTQTVLRSWLGWSDQRISDLGAAGLL
jgi:crotonobetainyl-CoA:carnitine CoA-transferase CaiB-like acyl-CoA transferase